MNDRNTELLFGDDDEDVVLTLTNEDGEEMDAEILASFEIEELGTEYIAVLPVTEDEEAEEREVVILRYAEDADGNPDISMIEDEEEAEIVAEGFRQMLQSGALEGFDCFDEDDEEEISDDYLEDIGDIFPGISIDRES